MWSGDTAMVHGWVRKLPMALGVLLGLSACASAPPQDAHARPAQYPATSCDPYRYVPPPCSRPVRAYAPPPRSYYDVSCRPAYRPPRPTYSYAAAPSCGAAYGPRGYRYTATAPACDTASRRTYAYYRPPQPPYYGYRPAYAPNRGKACCY